MIWILRWVTHQLFHSPINLFDANTYFPHHLTLAYSESMLPVAPLYAVWFLVSGSNWAFALNMTTISLVVLNLGATFALARWLIGRADAAFVAAIAFGANAYVFSHWGHTQLQTLGLLPLALLLLFRLLERPRPLLAVAVGLASATLVLSALYYGAAYAVAVVGILVVHLVHSRENWRQLLGCLMIAGAITGVLVAPTALVYDRVQKESDFKRPIEPEWGLDAIDLVRPAPNSYVYGALEPTSTQYAPWEHRFFQGFSVLALAGVGVFTLGRRRGAAENANGDETDLADTADTGPRRHYVVALAVGGVLTLILAIGPEVFGERAPYRWFHDNVPGFAGMRVTARLAVVTMLAVAVLAASGWAWLLDRVRDRRWALGLTGALLLVLAVEYAAPLPWVRLPTAPATLSVYKALARRGPGPVVELPIIDVRDRPAEWATVEATRLVYSTLDWHPRLNGYAGYIPAEYLSTVDALKPFPDRGVLPALRERHVRYVVAHIGRDPTTSGYPAARIEALRPFLPAGARLQRYGDAYLLELPAD